jgi:hypothetical protein
MKPIGSSKLGHNVDSTFGLARIQHNCRLQKKVSDCRVRYNMNNEKVRGFPAEKTDVSRLTGRQATTGITCGEFLKSRLCFAGAQVVDRAIVRWSLVARLSGRRLSRLLRGLPMIDNEASERFMNAPWLAEVDSDTKRTILSALVEARAPVGAILLAQGQPNDHLTFLIEGTAEIERTFDSGRHEILTALTAPAVFGTTSFFLPTPPSVTVRATSAVWMLSLYHPAHEEMRVASPRAAEALALAVVRALSERFNLMDKLFTNQASPHAEEPARKSEWAGFRAKLFEERSI